MVRQKAGSVLGVVVGAILQLTSSALEAQPAGPVDPALRRLVEAELRRDLADAFAMNGRPAQLVIQGVDLDGDGRVDAIVLMDHPYSCGSAGCAVHVFISEGSRLRRVGEFLANEVEPVTTSTEGWRDLSVNGRRWALQDGRYRVVR